MNLALGAIYSWSIFRTPLEESFGASPTESGLPYMLFLLFFALSMPLGGALIRKIGPRYTAISGSALVGLGWLLAGYSGSIALLAVSYGVLGGVGVGLAYGVPLAVAGRWFADRRGIALGLTLMGFGLSPLVTAPAAVAVISALSVLPAFRVMGMALFIFLIVLSLLMRYPDEAEEAAIPPVPAGAATAAVDRDTRAMLASRQFYGLWTTYVIGTLVGLTAIGITGAFAQQTVGLTAGQAALSVSIFAVCNGLGRPLFGYVTDRLGVVSAVIVAYGAIIVASGLLLVGGGDSVLLFALSFAMFWMLLGGWLAIAPAATTILFGPKHYPSNYGVMYTAYGVGAVLGTLLSGQINEIFGSYLYTFVPVIGLALIGTVIALLTLGKRVV